MAYVSENSVLFTALGQTKKFVASVRGDRNNSSKKVLLSFCQLLLGKKDVEQLTLLENGAAGSCASIFSGLI